MIVVVLENQCAPKWNKTVFICAAYFCFLGSNNCKQVFHPRSKKITEMHNTKIFPRVAMSLTLPNPHIHETSPLNTRSTL